MDKEQIFHELMDRMDKRCCPICEFTEYRLNEAYDSLLMVKRSIEDEMPEDFYSIDLMNAYEKLGSIVGESVEDDLVNEIFSKFCMGK